MEEAWKDCVSNVSNRGVKTLPLIVNWGTWVARNSTIFKDKSTTPNIIVVQGLIILSHFPQEKGMDTNEGNSRCTCGLFYGMGLF
jgi:hypothetical protein